MLKFLYALVFSSILFASDPYEEFFTDIYRTNAWCAESRSGGGSEPKNIGPFITYLETFIAENNIKSILDLGCGDFFYFKTIDLDGINYTGVDIVKEMIDDNNSKYGADNITFVQGNILDMELPKADLVICKHVLQHLSDEGVLSILKNIEDYPSCLFMNQTSSWRGYQSIKNIAFQGTRELDLFSPPFNLKGEKVCKFIIHHSYHSVILVNH